MNRNDENILKVLRAQADRLVQEEQDRNEELAIRKQIGELQHRLTQLQSRHGMDRGPTQEEQELLKVWARGEDVVQAKLAYERDGVPKKDIPALMGISTAHIHTGLYSQQTLIGQATGQYQNMTLGQACNLQAQLVGGGIYANQQQGIGPNRTV